MTEKEVQDVARLARAFDDADSGVMKMSHALAIARALLHVLAERDEARKNLEALASGKAGA